MPALRPGAVTAPMPPAPPAGNVVLTATDTVWLRIYDGNDKRLFEKEMAAGETYTVPADAQNQQILTGRPKALRVTLDGQAVAPRGPAHRTITQVGISAAPRDAPP